MQTWFHIQVYLSVIIYVQRHFLLHFMLCFYISALFLSCVSCAHSFQRVNVIVDDNHYGCSCERSYMVDT
ncbi:hypothetical protein L2E82_27564 [Cichorium intybus]|uniref:Uncharacterized protein n=1 Tax=Cichorium intybus TaxID=13427 RepID=A0ACB9CT70_CICIN|nr:hypothetical protein L2E82_27564 [Cichorium intybus]